MSVDNRTNFISMSVLAAAIVALGATILTGEYFHPERPEKMGYKVEGVEQEGGAGAAAPAIPIAALLPKANLENGATAFKACMSCHTINQGGANGIGPNLYGVVGKPIGTHPGFAYSDAVKGHGGTWTFDALNEWLTSPRNFAKGTKMTFAGISDPQKRADVIAYLNSQGSNLPFPPPPAEGAAKDGAAAGKAEKAGGDAGAANAAAAANAAVPAGGNTSASASAPATKDAPAAKPVAAPAH